jgi:hypothetical protein
MICAAQANKCRVSEATKSKDGKVRVIPVDASCSERHNNLDPPFVDQAAKELEEPFLPDAALQLNGSFRAQT